MSYPSYASINLYPIEDPRNRSNHVIPTTIRIIQWILTNYNLYSLKIAFVSLVSKPKNTNSQRWSDPDFFVGFTTLVAGWWFGTWLLWLSIIYGMSSLPLTNSIIFQRGRLNHQPDITIISVILSNIIPIWLSNYYHQPDSFAPIWNPWGLLLWDSRTVHQGWRGGPRLAQPICWEPRERRSQARRLNNQKYQLPSGYLT